MASFENNHAPEPATGADPRLKVLVYPQDGNPYQRLLYTAMQSRHPVEISYLRRYGFANVLMLPLMLTIRRRQGFAVLHIHWPEFRVQLPLPGRLRLSYWFAIGCIRWAARLGYRVVWTVHNAVPHEPATTDDAGVAATLAATAGAKIVHSTATATELRRRGWNVDNVHVIGHGNYADSYGAGPDRSTARTELGLADRDIVVLFFGLIRPYKGVLDLIEAFDDARSDLPRLRLVIAGRCLDPAVSARIDDRTDPEHRLVFVDDYIPDADVPRYFAAADLVGLPFRSVTTSGSALLALTFGTPVIVHRVGDLAELPDDVGFGYGPTTETTRVTELAQALRIAAAAIGDLEPRRQAALEFSQTRSWPAIADATYHVYTALFDD